MLRCAFADFGHLAEGARGPQDHADLVRARVHPADADARCPTTQATEVLKLVDMLEQDEDVQRVFHNLG